MYLNAYFSTISKNQRDYILSLLKSKTVDGTIFSDSSYLDSLNEEVAKLGQLGGLLTLRYGMGVYEELSSEMYNDFFSRVNIDLYALYKELINVQNIIERHKTINKDKNSKLFLSLSTLRRKLLKSKAIDDINNGYNEIIVNKFTIDDNKTSFGVLKRADIDIGINELRLPVLIDNNKLYPLTTPPARMTITEHANILYTIDNTTKHLLKAIDISDDTYWNQRAISDIPVITTVDILHTGNYEVYHGTVTSIELSLFKPSRVNTFLFNPYSEYPISILSINIYRSESLGWEQAIPLNVTFPLEIDSPVRVDIEVVEAKQIEFVINQKYFSKKTYIIPRKDIDNAILYKSLSNPNFTIYDESAQGYISRGRVESRPGWATYINMLNNISRKYMENNDSTQIDKIVKSSLESLLSVSKMDPTNYSSQLINKAIKVRDDNVVIDAYEYNYGAFNIEASETYYAREGHYLSSYYTVEGNIIEVALEVDSEIPDNTSVEYDLVVPFLEPIPILPIGTTSVVDELLSVDPITREAVLRFTPSSTPIIYKDNVSIYPSGYTYISPSSVIIESEYYSIDAFYSADYVPSGISESIYVNLLERSTTLGTLNLRSVTLEEAPTLDFNNSYKLNHYPYLEWDEIYGPDPSSYTPISLYIGSDEEEAVDLTYYVEDKIPTLTTYDAELYPRYEFYLDGSRVYTNLSTSEIIKSTYKYLANSLKLQIVVRRNDKEDLTKTPVIREYKLKLKVEK